MILLNRNSCVLLLQRHVRTVRIHFCSVCVGYHTTVPNTIVIQAQCDGKRRFGIAGKILPCFSDVCGLLPLIGQSHACGDDLEGRSCPSSAGLAFRLRCDCRDDRYGRRVRILLRAACIGHRATVFYVVMIGAQSDRKCRLGVAGQVRPRFAAVCRFLPLVGDPDARCSYSRGPGGNRAGRARSSAGSVP